MKTLIFVNGPMGVGKTARSRLERDIQAGMRGKDIIERALDYLPLYDCQDTIKIVTDGLSPEEVTRQIVPGEGSF